VSNGTKHWTQTIEGKKKMSRSIKAAWKARKKAEKVEGKAKPTTIRILGSADGALSVNTLNSLFVLLTSGKTVHISEIVLRSEG
jgi:hypothetical protein